MYSGNNIPIYTRFDCIYVGPHVDEDGKLDPRTWFSIPIALDVDQGSITYIVFPYGGSDDEIREVVADVNGTWIA